PPISTWEILNRNSYWKWLLTLVFSPLIINTIQSQPACISATFCMSSPYYDPYENLFAIDVSLVDFADESAGGIVLEVYYSNTNFIVDETKTEASIYPALDYILGTFSMEFDNSPGRIDVKGAIFPPEDGPTFTTTNNQLLFTIYFSAAVGECADFSFGQTRFFWVYDPGVSYQICSLGIGSGCEPSDVCMAGHSLSGNIESPALDCLDAQNGGIPNNVVEIAEANGMPGFGCSTLTDEYGDYECNVVEDLDYRVEPVNDNDRLCGITELDFDIIHDFILGRHCLDYVWQLLAADVNQNGLVSTLDLVALQNAVLENPVDWPSWTFVPVDQYTEMDPDLCEHDVPSYDRFIDVTNVEDDVTDLDFVGIKMGDVNATCTECEVPLTGGEKVWKRSSPVNILVEKVDKNEYSLSFNVEMVGLDVLMFSLKCESEPQIKYNALQTNTTFKTKYKDGIFYVCYVSLVPDGESFAQESTFLTLEGDFKTFSTGETNYPNSLVSNEYHSQIQIQERLSPLQLVYPNPASRQIVVQLIAGDEDNNERFYLYDLCGKTVLTKNLTKKQSKIDLDLVPGLYYYKIQSYKSESSGKLIIN
ncbi:MAG: T9SS type A sorting domain-containing protein, partial [Saprospiraceae bacterium]